MRFAIASLGALLLVSAPSPARAGTFPTRQGESGLLDVPDAELIPRRTGMVGLELGWETAPGKADHYGPMPLSLGVGLGRFEWAVSARESGYPGDPRPAPMLFGTALKLGLLAAAGHRPAVAVDAYLDRFNDGGYGGARLILSTPASGQLRLAGVAGYEQGIKGGKSGLTAGLAAAARHRSGLEAVLEGLTTPRGPMYAAAVRVPLNGRLGVGLVGSYLPDEKGYRIAVAFGFHAVPVARAQTGAPVAVEAPPAVTEPEPGAQPAPDLGDRPRFKLKIPVTDPARLGEPRHLEYGPYVPAGDEGGKP